MELTNISYSIDEFKNPKEKLLVFLVLLLSTYVFLVYLNYVFPTQSDDIGRKVEGIGRAITSYMTWNGRFGELLLVSFGSYFSTTPYYPFVNAFIGSSVIMMVFIIMFGHLPSNTKKDISFFAIILSYIMVDRSFSFGSVFYWAAGSFNYLWAWFFILLTVLPVALFFHGVKPSKGLNTIITVTGIPLGIVAGWSSEFGVVIIILWITSLVYKRIKKDSLPIWYYTSLASFVIGWLILYNSPGISERAKLFANYCSLIDLVRLGPIGLAKRIVNTFNSISKWFYYENFCLISLFLLLTTLLFRPSLKKLESTTLAILTMAFCLRSMPRVFFILSALLICIMCAFVIRKENSFLSNLFMSLSGIVCAEFLFILATIQIGIPRRACFQYTILNIGIIAIIITFCFESFKDNKRVQSIAMICCIGLTMLLCSFVIKECTNMSNKWSLMEKSIVEQKNQGINEIVIDRNTFISRYWGYGDWGNPGENPSEWPNTSYAEYYEVDSIVAK